MSSIPLLKLAVHVNLQSQYHHLPAEREHYLDSNVIAAIFQYSAQPAALFYVDIIPSFRHNKKTCQWDVRTNEVTMEYGEHLGPVNTATLIDDDRFVFYLSCSYEPSLTLNSGVSPRHQTTRKCEVQHVVSSLCC